jgi:hypothetical protein
VRKRIVVWGVVAALVVVAAGLVVIAGGGDGDGEGDAASPRLPLDLAGAQGPEPAADALAIGLVPTHYAAADDLPEMGGDEPAYRLSVTAEDVAVLAEALGIGGEPQEQDGSWHVEGDGLALDAYGPGGAWSAFPTGQGPDTPQSSPPAPPDTATGGGSSGNPGSGGGPEPATTESTIVCVTTPCEPAVSDPPVAGTAQASVQRPTSPEPVQECPADPGGASCAPPCEPGPAVTCPADTTVPETTIPGTGPDTIKPCEPGPAVTCPAPGTPTPTTPPGDLPSESEALDLAARLVSAAGFEPEEAQVDATSELGSWSVTFEPTLDGREAPGLAGLVVVGADGVESASGYFAPGDPLGDYPLLTTREAIDRLNTPGEVTAMEGAAASGSDAAPAAAPTTGTRPAPSSEQIVVAETRPATGQEPAGAPTDPATGVSGQPVPGEPAPGEPAPEPAPQPAPTPEPTEVVLTGVEIVYTTVPSWDGSGAYVVPSYRFTGEGGEEVVISAVADEALRPPPGD